METKAAWRTTEFWLAVVTNVTAIITALAGVLPGKYAAPTLAATNGLYALARGLAKQGIKPTP